MKAVKEILFSLTKNFNDRVEEAKKTAEKMVRTAEAARTATQITETKEAQPSPKK